MSSSETDQIGAAVAQTRQTVASALGITEPPGRGCSPFFERLWERHLNDPRCRHLRARPVQPSYLAPAERAWRCGPCLKASTPMRLSPIEDYTCDGCRRYIPTGKLGPAVVRQDMWVITCGLCDGCMSEVQAQGGRLVGGAP